MVTPLLTIQAVSEYLNVKCSTVYAWVAQKKIPALKIHGLIRSRREELDAWLDSFQADGVSQPPALAVSSRARPDIDTLLAKVKRDVYTAHRGEPRPKSSLIRKEEMDGAV